MAIYKWANGAMQEEKGPCSVLGPKQSSKNYNAQQLVCNDCHLSTDHQLSAVGGVLCRKQCPRSVLPRVN